MEGTGAGGGEGEGRDGYVRLGKTTLVGCRGW